MLTVQQLIKFLQKCPQDAFVRYDPSNYNENRGIYTTFTDYMDIDNVEIGCDNESGYVYLTED